MRCRLDSTRTGPVTKRLLELCHIERRYHHVSVDQIKQDSARKKIQHYVDNIEEACHKGYGLVLTGSFRSGKTSAAIAVGKQLLTCRGSVLFARSTELVRAGIEETYYEDGETLEERAQDVWLLIIDDVGAEKEGVYYKSVLEEFVRVRYNAMLPTIITTNLEAAELKQKHKGIWSILKANCMFVDLENSVWEAYEEEGIRAFEGGSDGR